MKEAPASVSLDGGPHWRGRGAFSRTIISHYLHCTSDNPPSVVCRLQPPNLWSENNLVRRNRSTALLVTYRTISGAGQPSAGFLVFGESDGQRMRQWNVEVTFNDKYYCILCCLSPVRQSFASRISVTRISPVSLAPTRCDDGDEDPTVPMDNLC